MLDTISNNNETSKIFPALVPLLLALLQRPDEVDYARLVNACRAVARWAERRGYTAVQLAFTQAAARLMQEGGSIINLSSVNAVLAIPNQIPYAISKGAIRQLTNVTAVALAPRGIRVNAIGPGTIMTEMGKSVMASEEQRQRILSRTPLGRVGDPEEIASIAAFLASDEASYITGQTIYADGGRLGLNYIMPVS